MFIYKYVVGDYFDKPVLNESMSPGEKYHWTTLCSYGGLLYSKRVLLYQAPIQLARCTCYMYGSPGGCPRTCMYTQKKRGRNRLSESKHIAGR